MAEDEPGLRKYVREVLERYGYTVLEARDGVEALDLAQKNSNRIELLLTDVVMPRMGGIELTSRFRDLCPRVPVLHMSGYTYRAVRGAEALDSYIQKPFTPSALLGRMRSLLNAVARQY